MASRTSTVQNCLVAAGYTKQEVKELFFENPDLEYDNLRAMDFLSRREQDLLRAKRNVQIQALRMNNLEQQVAAFPGSRKAALRSTMTKSGVDVNVSTTEGRYTTIRDQSLYKVIEGLEEHKGTLLSRLASDKEFGKDVFREARGKKTGNSLAAKVGKDMYGVNEGLRLRYNKAGGNIGKLADWSIVQTHDALKIGKLTADEWIREIKPLLDFDRMKLKKEDEIQAILAELHTEYKTGGVKKLNTDTLPADAKAALANRYGDRHRFLHFIDEEAFLKYQEKFGSEDIFASMISHIDTMSKDIAIMETFGPNPRMTFKYLKESAVRETGNQNVADSAENIFKEMMGETMAKNAWVADRMGSLRAAVGAGKLKFAAISAITDLAFTGVESHFAGVPVMKTYSRFISQIWRNGDKRLAARVAGVAEYAMDSLAQNQRYMDVSAGSGAANKALAFTVRASFLEGWTNAGKRAFGLEFAADMGQHIGKSLDALPFKTRRMLGIYGIDEADWKALKGAAYKEKGTTYISLQDIVDDDLAAKYGTMVRGEMKYAVPEPGWREQAIMKQGTQSGTLEGESLRMSMQFKSFPITLLTTWWSRVLFSQALDGTMSRVGYAGALAASTTMLGYMAISAKDVFRGKTPPPMDDPKTWVRSFLQGGSGGPVMDILAESATGKTAEFVAGPLPGEAAKLLQILSSNATRFVEGKDTHLSHSLLNQVRRSTPGAWYMALPMRRAVADQLNKVIDEDQFRQNARRARTRARKEGQDITWEPGEFTPEIMQ